MSNTPTPLRTAVIGLGIGRVHVEGYALSPHADLVALCDADPNRLQEFGLKYNVPAEGLFSDYKTLFAQANLDLVSIVLPNSLHAQVSIDAMEAGVNVIVEKPMSITEAEAQRMIDVAHKTNKRLMVMYNRRYRADALWMYDLIRNGDLGDIYQVDIYWRRETGIPGWGWAGDKSVAGGGALIDLGVHALDLALWMLDFPKVKTVSGATRTLFGQHGLKTWGDNPQARDFGVEDGAVGFMRFDNGVNMTVQASWAEHIAPKEDRLRIEFQGTKGGIVLDIPNYTREDTLRYYTEINGVPSTIIPHLSWKSEDVIAQFVMDAAKRLVNDEPAPTTGEEGLKAVRIMQALYQSAEQGHEISF